MENKTDGERLKELKNLLKKFRKKVGISKKTSWGETEINQFIKFLADSFVGAKLSGNFIRDYFRLMRALKYAIEIIECYEADCKDVDGYIKEFGSTQGFCQGSIYRDAIKDIKKIAGIK